jgi:N-acyl-D-amino-acid deacylase
MTTRNKLTCCRLTSCRVLLCHTTLASLLAFALTAEVNAQEETSTRPDGTRMRAAIKKSLPLLEQAAAGSADQRKCFMCHGQALPVMAASEARLRGFAIDEQNFARQLEHTTKHLKRGQKDYLKGKGQGGRVDMAGYALWTLEAGGRAGDDVTDAVAEYILQADVDRGYWQHTSNRPPSEASDFTTTYLALRALTAFAPDDQQQRTSQRVALAADWLREHKPADVEDRVFQLRAMSYAGLDEESQRPFAHDLLALQNDDGGWAQKSDLASDAYATGSALVALLRTGHLTPSSESYRRGVTFLLDSQQQDGSWHVVSRSKPFQKHFESGFPHGKDQFISTSATGWATIALLLGLPDDSPTASSR